MAGQRTGVLSRDDGSAGQGEERQSTALLATNAVGVVAHPESGRRRKELPDAHPAVSAGVPCQRHAVAGVEGRQPGTGTAPGPALSEPYGLFIQRWCPPM